MEPAPFTIAVPVEPAWSAIMPRVLFTVPPFWMVNAPVPKTPTRRPVDCAPGAPITVALGATVSICVLVASVGTPADQLLALNQSLEAVPVHCASARDGIAVVVTSPSAIADDTLRPRRHLAKFDCAGTPIVGFLWRPSEMAASNSAAATISLATVFTTPGPVANMYDAKFSAKLTPKRNPIRLFSMQAINWLWLAND